MNDNEVVKARTDDLVALCHILDEYPSFIENLEKNITVKNNRDFIYYLQCNNNNNIFNLKDSKKAKKFYLENKNVIDEINKYSNIGEFIRNYYTSDGNLASDYNLKFFYEYFIENIDSIQNILNILNRISSFGIEEINFNSNFDFSKDEYVIYTNFSYNINVEYLEKIDVIPNYQNNIIKYKSLGSNYKISLRLTKDEINKCSRSIIVNNLLFDVDRLPLKLTKEIVYDKLILLKKEKEIDIEKLKNSIKLSLGIDDLYGVLTSLYKISTNISDSKYKSLLTEIIVRMGVDLTNLKNISDNYDNSIINNENLLTEETLKKEKILYLKRKSLANIDYD